MQHKAPSHAAKQRVYEQFARIPKALAAAAELSVANTSQHLQVLAAARLVETRRDGQRILYRVADDSIQVLWHALRRTTEARIAELDQVAREYLIGRDECQAIERTEL